jgi:hypothetical protein
MRQLICSLLLSAGSFFCFSQNPNDILFGANLDLIKSDHDGYFEKAQVGLEGHYFFSRKFAGTTGFEIWTEEGASVVVGARYYPIKDAFLRARGLIGQNDFSVGAGFAKPITEHMYFDAMADFYFEGEFCIRAGISYFLKRAQK